MSIAPYDRDTEIEAYDDEETQEVNLGGTAIELATRAEIAAQVAVARQYPRSIKRFLNTAREMATLDPRMAEACNYAVPRGGKIIEGPSVRLAEIAAYAWGHLRVEAKIVSEDERFVTARGVCHDMQTNVFVAYETKRKISYSNGRRYNDDMIATTGNAAASIALRNAIFRVIPNALIKPLADEAKMCAKGDVKTLSARRSALLEHFGRLGAKPEDVYRVLGVAGVEDITLDHLLTMQGIAAAIKDGETTFESVFTVPVTVASKSEGITATLTAKLAESPAPPKADPAPAATPKAEPAKKTREPGEDG